MALYEIDTLKESIKKYLIVAATFTTLGIGASVIYCYATRKHMHPIEQAIREKREDSLYRKNLREYELYRKK